MKNIKYTKHASLRCQQRGIPDHIVEFIYLNGECKDSFSDQIYYMSGDRMKELWTENKDYLKNNEKHLKKTKVVCNSNDVITAMKIKKKIRWN
tara:strand:+ start:40 stop:318 length:279 start_codon:yes stop_codon:yes gene_type:complete